MSNHENGITTGEFVSVILRRFRETEGFGRDTDADVCVTTSRIWDVWQRGMEKGWLEEQERLEAEKPLERRTAAKIVHEFLRRECGEADEADWGAARRLKDLYDCRTCVNHVAQVYAKGIMTGLSEEIFGMREGLRAEEAAEIAERLIDRKRRRPPLDAGKDGVLSRSLSLEKALALARGDSGAVLVDVRTREAYAKEHLNGAVNIPFSVILEDPGAVMTDQTAPLLLYCDAGYQSEIAANRLAEAGYLQVYSFATKNVEMRISGRERRQYSDIPHTPQYKEEYS